MEFFSFFIINLVKVIKYLILVRVLISWVQPHGGSGAISNFIYQTTEPILSFFRSILPKTGMIDLSPILAFFALDLIEIGLARLLSGF